MSEESEALGELLRARRQQLGLTLREAAGQIGCHFSTLYRAEQAIDITFDNFVLFARWLGMPLLEDRA